MPAALFLHFLFSLFCFNHYAGHNHSSSSIYLIFLLHPSRLYKLLTLPIYSLYFFISLLFQVSSYLLLLSRSFAQKQHSVRFLNSQISFKMHSHHCSWQSRALVALISLAASVSAHTWVEQLNVIDPNGTFVGAPGFPRGNGKKPLRSWLIFHHANLSIVPRGPGFSDSLMVHLLPPPGRAVTEGDKGFLKSDLMCRDSQTKPDPDKSPRLQATAGGFVALRYQENGHVTLPDNPLGKAPNRGTVFIYGTSEPLETDTFLGIHKQWNSAGTGGDKRGKLIASQDFDDSQCYQINGGSISVNRQQEFPHQFDQSMGNDIWCQNNIALPSDLPVGKAFTLYWVWDWATLPNIDPGLPDGKEETYTTCMDIDITGTADNTRVNAATNPQQKNAGVAPSADNAILNNAAIPKYMKELLKEAVAPGPSAEAGSTISATQKSEPSAKPTPEKPASEKPAPEKPAPEKPASEKPAPEKPVIVTVTEKPAVASIIVTVMVSKSSTPATTTVTAPRSTITMVGKTVTMTMESSESSAGPDTPNQSPSPGKKHKRSRIHAAMRDRY